MHERNPLSQNQTKQSTKKAKTMKISSIEKMEELVKGNKELMWDGWTVVHFYASEKGRTARFGARIKDRWYITKRFEPTEEGWEIPNKFVRK
jgi:hypothetical protein